jgi:hypothetical protein
VVDIRVLVPWPITTSWYLALWMRPWQCPWAFVSSVNLNWTEQKTIGNLIVMLWGESRHRFLSTLPLRKKMLFKVCEALAWFLNTGRSWSYKVWLPSCLMVGSFSKLSGICKTLRRFTKSLGISQVVICWVCFMPGDAPLPTLRVLPYWLDWLSTLDCHELQLIPLCPPLWGRPEKLP